MDHLFIKYQGPDSGLFQLALITLLDENAHCIPLTVAYHLGLASTTLASPFW